MTDAEISAVLAPFTDDELLREVGRRRDVRVRGPMRAYNRRPECGKRHPRMGFKCRVHAGHDGPHVAIRPRYGSYPWQAESAMASDAGDPHV